jgi:hypothetical protein
MAYKHVVLEKQDRIARIILDAFMSFFSLKVRSEGE